MLITVRWLEQGLSQTKLSIDGPYKNEKPKKKSSAHTQWVVGHQKRYGSRLYRKSAKEGVGSNKIMIWMLIILSLSICMILDEVIAQQGDYLNQNEENYLNCIKRSGYQLTCTWSLHSFFLKRSLALSPACNLHLLGLSNSLASASWVSRITGMCHRTRPCPSGFSPTWSAIWGMWDLWFLSFSGVL